MVDQNINKIIKVKEYDLIPLEDQMKTEQFTGEAKVYFNQGKVKKIEIITSKKRFL